MPSAAEQIYNALLLAKRAKTKEEQDNAIKVLSGLSNDYSSKEYPKMTLTQFASGNTDKASLSPEEILKSYYGENLPREIIAAGNYNIQRPTVPLLSYAKIFDRIPASKTIGEGSSYYPNYPTSRGNPMVKFDTASKEEVDSNKKWLTNRYPSPREIAKEFFKANSIDPTLPSSSYESILEHEVGHHITIGNPIGYKPKELPNNARYYGRIASDGFSKFGEHTGQIDETTQALGRFQREMFKNTGKRLHPVEFMGLVNRREIPDFLTPEGRRILIYSQNLKDVADKSKDKNKKDAALKALEAISRMAPAVVSNKKHGLDLPIA